MLWFKSKIIILKYLRKHYLYDKWDSKSILTFTVSIASSYIIYNKVCDPPIIFVGMENYWEWSSIFNTLYKGKVRSKIILHNVFQLNLVILIKNCLWFITTINFCLKFNMIKVHKSMTTFNSNSVKDKLKFTYIMQLTCN